ncbi:hypothetical protein H0H93_014719 [Arthromyces matolae]|nr:hypothetical protein H0H93_014719 [Arthromyces matolae]
MPHDDKAKNKVNGGWPYLAWEQSMTNVDDQYNSSLAFLPLLFEARSYRPRSTQVENHRLLFTACVEGTRAKVFLKVEIPGVDPKDVKLTLDGTRLRITGERSPDLSDVPEEYRDEVGVALSQSDLYGLQRAKLIVIGDGFVQSVSPDGVQGRFNRAQSPSTAPNVDAATSASPSGAHLRPERSFYDELRYGTFCRDFRVGPGTKACSFLSSLCIQYSYVVIQPSDIQGYFSNGMLMLSWPKRKAPTSANVESESDMDVEDNIIPNASATPVSVKFESSNVDDEPQR